ncbi:hypothetical protein CYMTET_12007 [Cymbomonas tetramitiformis]|uniref:Uncharacterized protein n=1 Tax=Cymbomonas tetramitiformis TaxID=36881 RepID=A0AAE0LCW6_9CHLO|nr:hypothetical protein CYMTET_12007 [Cymbomonas tetramitiformis]
MASRLPAVSYEDSGAKVDVICAKERQRHQWAKAIRELLALDGKERWTGSLVLVDFNGPTKQGIEKINELLYDTTLTYVVKGGSPMENSLLGTDSLSDRDGRRALLDLIKDCVPPGVRQPLQEEHSRLRYPARVDPRPLLTKEKNLVWFTNKCAMFGVRYRFLTNDVIKPIVVSQREALG